MTIVKLYQRTCDYYQKKPDDAAADAWKNTLKMFSIGEIESALQQHEADTRVDDFGRTRGAWMPFASDLAALIANTRRQTAISNKFRSCGHCEEGWLRVFSGQTIGNNEGKKAKVDAKVGAVIMCQCRVEWIQGNRQTA